MGFSQFGPAVWPREVYSYFYPPPRAPGEMKEFSSGKKIKGKRENKEKKVRKKKKGEEIRKKGEKGRKNILK